MTSTTLVSYSDSYRKETLTRIADFFGFHAALVGVRDTDSTAGDKTAVPKPTRP